MARDKTSSGARRRRWPWVLLGFGVLAFVLVGLGLLARPMMDVKPEADAARDELGMAQDALKDEDLDAAKVHVAAARAHVDEASTLVNGFGGDVWRWVPVGGGAIQDVRHLVGALDQATAIAEIGTEVYPELMQSDSLVQNAQVDLDQLDGILTSLNQAGLHLHAAVDDLEAVDGNTPFIGDKVLEARDQAWDKIEPISTTYDEAEPVLDALPDVLGRRGRPHLHRRDHEPGRAALLRRRHPDAGPDDDVRRQGRVRRHRDQRGHRRRRRRARSSGPRSRATRSTRPARRVVMSATFSPYWSQSGEELLRAWEARFGQKADGVITVDLQALARLMDLTGPVEAEGVGELNSGNLVKVLAGSYDFYDSEEERRAINAAVVPAFREKLFQGGQFAEKFQVLARAAKGRHFAMYFRDPRLQEAFLKRGLAGDLSDTDHDYVGVFTQNLNSSKSDYWQTRSVASDVQLAADGSAEVTLTATVQNTSPPFTPPWTDNQPEDPAKDPRWGYYTRWAGNAIAVFLPKGAEVQGQATIRGVPFKPIVRSVLDRPYFYRKVLIEPGGQAVVTVKYRVPNAATVDGDTLTYHLDIDPQSLVNPETVDVTLHLPDGYGVAAPPAGWTQTDAQTLQLQMSLDDSPRFEVEASKQ